MTELWHFAFQDWYHVTGTILLIWVPLVLLAELLASILSRR